MSGSLREPSRSASTHSLSLFIAEYGQPNALQHATKITVKFTQLKSIKQHITHSASVHGFLFAVTPGWAGSPKIEKKMLQAPACATQSLVYHIQQHK